MRFAHTLRFVAALLLTLAASAAAWGETVAFRAKLELTVFDTAVDTNGDALTASSAVGGGRSSAGAVNIESWIEFLPWDGSTFCGPTHVQLGHHSAEHALRFADGSRLFLAFRSGSLCFDFSNNTSTAIVQLAVVGGSGRFAGASGALTWDGASYLVPFYVGFAPISVKLEGEITLPPR